MKALTKKLAKGVLNLFGWEIEKKTPPRDKYILIGAPHTSYKDFFVGILAIAAMDIRGGWVGKKPLFDWPLLGSFLKLIGGIPVNRKIRTGFVDKMVEKIEESEEFVLVLAPEGTRAKTEQWKTGFYYIAKQCSVPIALGYVDFEKKKIGVSGWLSPEKEIEQIEENLQDFYQDKQGDKPSKRSTIKLTS